MHTCRVLSHSVLTLLGLLGSSVGSGSENVLAVRLLVSFKHQHRRLSRMGVNTNYFTYTAIIVAASRFTMANLKLWLASW